MKKNKIQLLIIILIVIFFLFSTSSCVKLFEPPDPIAEVEEPPDPIAKMEEPPDPIAEDINEEEIAEPIKEETEDKDEPEADKQEEGSQDTTRGSNNDPYVTDIILPPYDILVGSQNDISATAEDPDGDTLSYSWSVSGGTIDDYTSNPIVWTSPSSDGIYDITLLVDDGNGGNAARTESVTVYPLPPPPPIIIEPPIIEAGTIYKGLMVRNDPTALIKVGDSNDNRFYDHYTIKDTITMRGFFCFDITGLAGTIITSATLVLGEPLQYGNPYDHLIEAFRVRVVNWGDDPLELSDYDLGSKPLGLYTDPNIVISNQDLINALQAAVDNQRKRFQIRISHKGYQTNYNNEEDFVYYGREHIHLIVEVNFT